MTATTPTRARELYAQRPGRTVGGLVFRVGYADETLATSGTTALVVALALRAVERPGLDISASVGPTVTHVRVSASDERVRSTLRELSLALADLSVRHRATETRALEERTDDGAVQPWRFGLRSYGLGPSQFLGLHRVTDDELRAWARDRFAAANAVVWVTGETALDLDLALPAGSTGTPLPPPEVAGPAVPLPAEALAGGSRVLWDAVVPDTPALTVLAEVARRALFQGLRQDRGWTYDVSAVIGTLDGRQANLQIAVGLRPETAAQATGEFLDTLGRLRFAVADDELQSARAHLLAAYEEPHQDAMWLHDDAVLTLLGRPVPTSDERRSAVARVTAEDVRALARQVWDSGLLVTPVGSGWAGTEALRSGAGEPLPGKAFERVDVDATIRVGEDGVTLRDGRRTTTVRFDETAALVAYPDGGRLLVGLDGARVPFEPTLHDDLRVADLGRLVDEHVDAALVVPVPRPEAPGRPDPDVIKQASQARAAREVDEDGLARTTGLLALAVGKVVVVLALVLVLLAAIGGTLVSGAVALGEVGAWLDGDGTWDTLAVVLPTGLVSAGVAWLSYRAILRLGGEDKGKTD
ncbi:M16 family metallopeptidase [Promicromonospora sp. NPDC059942]|uniref:M16 family metallopeptidase n=1 Tax=Promicromonospora sp. NPDC059942 TaxID=3347009 RepID=UPI00365F3174